MNNNDIVNFTNAIESMRKYQRYELLDNDNKDLLDKIYVDPLKGNGILNTCLKDNTTVLIGRKGTGKSTILMQLQNELRKSKPQILSVYLDVKEIYNQSERSGQSLPKSISDLNINFDAYLLQRQFIFKFLEELILEIRKASDSVIKKIQTIIGVSETGKAIKKINALQEKIRNNKQFGQIEIQTIQEISSEMKSSTTVNGNVVLSPKEINANVGACAAQENSKRFSNMFVKIFEIDNIINEIKEILRSLSIKKLFIILDDYSEIEAESLKLFCDVVITPLDNSSDNFIKLKICAYPGRVELGKLDPQKIDIRNIDYYNLYIANNRTDMELNAIDFTKRIIEKRLEIYTGKNFEFYFDCSKTTPDEYYLMIFQMTLNVIRHIGLIFTYAFEDAIRNNSKITKTILNESCKKFYTERISLFFTNYRHAQVAYGERAEVFQLEKLLNSFVIKQKENKRKITTEEYTAKIYATSQTNPFTSHFSTLKKHESALVTLEHHFFIHKYNEMVNKKGQEVSIYALNYGLCLNENIRWGKPDGGEYRTYFIESPFDFTNLITDFIITTRKIHCSKCGHVYTEEQFSIIQEFDFKCIKCDTEKAVKFEYILNDLEKNEFMELDKNYKLLEKEQIELINALYIEPDANSAKFLAGELDFSVQKIGWIAKKLREDYEYLIKETTNNGVVYTLTHKAKKELELQ